MGGAFATAASRAVEELQPQVEHLAGLAGLQIIRGVIEEEVTRRVGPRYQPDPASGCVRWGQQPGYVVFAGQKWRWNVPECACGRPGVCLDSYARLQHDGRRQRAVQEGRRGADVADYRRRCRACSMATGSRVQRESGFVAASAAQLKLCEKTNELELVAVLIDGIHLGQQCWWWRWASKAAEQARAGPVARSDGKHHGGPSATGNWRLGG